jgi:hypothetical protein
MSRVSWLVLLCVLFAVGYSSSAQQATIPANSPTISTSQPSNSESPTLPQQQAQQPQSEQTPQPQTQSVQPLTPLPAQLPPGMTPEQARLLLIALWPTIVDWSINSDKLPPLASLSLTFLSSSQQIATGQSASINSGQQASSSGEQNATAAGESAQAAAGSAASAVSESQIAAIQAQAAADATKAAAKPLADAQKQVKTLGIEIAFLKVGCVTLGVSTAGLAIYEVGRWIKWWK